MFTSEDEPPAVSQKAWCAAVKDFVSMVGRTHADFMRKYFIKTLQVKSRDAIKPGVIDDIIVAVILTPGVRFFGFRPFKNHLSSYEQSLFLLFVGTVCTFFFFYLTYSFLEKASASTALTKLTEDHKIKNITLLIRHSHYLYCLVCRLLVTERSKTAAIFIMAFSHYFSRSQALPGNGMPEALPPFSGRATKIALRGRAS